MSRRPRCLVVGELLGLNDLGELCLGEKKKEDGYSCLENPYVQFMAYFQGSKVEKVSSGNTPELRARAAAAE